MSQRKSRFSSQAKYSLIPLSFLVSLCTFLTSPVMAQTSISRLLQADATDLKLYEKADSKSNVITVEVKALPLPLNILESSNGMHQVQYNGKSYWIRIGNSISPVEVSHRPKSSASSAPARLGATIWPQKTRFWPSLMRFAGRKSNPGTASKTALLATRLQAAIRPSCSLPLHRLILIRRVDIGTVLLPQICLRWAACSGCLGRLRW
jgi:hypothetical protein